MALHCYYSWQTSCGRRWQFRISITERDAHCSDDFWRKNTKLVPAGDRVRAVVQRWMRGRGIGRGYGFAKTYSGEDFFVHSSSFNGETDIAVDETIIEFDVKVNERPGKYDEAINVDIL